VLLTHEFQPFYGGISTYCQELAGALHEEGCRVEVWAPTYAGVANEDGRFPFSVRRLPVEGRLTPWDIGRLAICLAKHSRELADATLVVASHGTLMAVILADFLRVRLGGKVICIWHGSEMLKLENSMILSALAKRFAAHPRVSCAAVSRYTIGLAERFLGPSASKKVNLLPGAPSTFACRQPLNPPVPSAGMTNLLTVARLHPRKGQLDVVRAMARLPLELKKTIVYRVAGIGAGDYLDEIGEYCRQNEISFIPLGAVRAEDLPGLYASCDLFVMPSRLLKRSVEGLGIAYLEAGWHGKPSIGYRTGGVEEAVLDGETGLLVDEGDIGALANAMQRLILDVELRRRYGENARRFARTFSWQKTARDLIAIARENGVGLAVDGQAAPV
jgi:glycosyltransferase involved in cell wall biosynthesis